MYYIADSVLALPGDESRVIHDEKRPVLVISDQNEAHGVNAEDKRSWPTVLVVPISSSTSYKTRFDVRLPAGCGNLPKKGWARIPAVQPVEKDHLRDMLGQVPSEVLDEVTAQVLNYLGLIEPETELDDSEEEALL